ncbi:MAG TPA: hypothetical protein VGL34_26330 [Steroidobacteraceae bacterium]|jgi:hypothetical protein
MITAAQCNTFITECTAVGTAPGISLRRATAAMAVCHTLTALAHHVAHYEVIVKMEGKLAASITDAATGTD